MVGILVLAFLAYLVTLNQELLKEPQALIPLAGGLLALLARDPGQK